MVVWLGLPSAAAPAFASASCAATITGLGWQSGSPNVTGGVFVGPDNTTQGDISARVRFDWALLSDAVPGNTFSVQLPAQLINKGASTLNLSSADGTVVATGVWSGKTLTFTVTNAAAGLGNVSGNVFFSVGWDLANVNRTQGGTYSLPITPCSGAATTLQGRYLAENAAGVNQSSGKSGVYDAATQRVSWTIFVKTASANVTSPVTITDPGGAGYTLSCTGIRLFDRTPGGVANDTQLPASRFSCASNGSGGIVLTLNPVAGVYINNMESLMFDSIRGAVSELGLAQPSLTNSATIANGPDGATRTVNASVTLPGAGGGGNGTTATFTIRKSATGVVPAGQQFTFEYRCLGASFTELPAISAGQTTQAVTTASTATCTIREVNPGAATVTYSIISGTGASTTPLAPAGATVTFNAGVNSTVVIGAVNAFPAPSPAIDLQKTADVANVDSVGDLIRYTLTARNTGNVPLTNVTVTDSLLGLNAAACAATLAPDATCTVTGSYTVTQADLDRGNVPNRATTTGTPPNGGTPPTDTAEVTVPALRTPRIDLTKTADPTSFDSVGDVITYTLTTTNTGNVTLTNVTTTDALLGINAQTCAATLAPGATCTVTGSHTITQADLNAGSVRNAASTTGTPPGGATPPTDTAEVTTPGTRNPALSIVKTSDVAVFDSVGDVISYTLTTTNTGNVTLTNVTTTDVLLGINARACAATLLPGATCTVTGSHTVTQADLDAGSVVNAASTRGTAPGGSTPTAQTTHTVPGANGPAIEVVKTADVATFDSVGDVINYTLTTTNTGNVTLTNVTTTDALLGINARACAATLAPGASCTVTGSYTVTQADLNAGRVLNAASTTGTPPGGGTPPTDTTEVTTPGTLSPAVELVKTADRATFTTVGQVITYTLTTTNTGNVTLTNVTTTDALLGINAQVCAATLAPGASCTVSGTHAITQADLNAGSIVNAASTTGTPPGGGTPPTDTATVTVPGTQTPALELVKTASPNPFTTVGQVITFTLTTTNTGNVALSHVTTTDALLGIDAQVCAATLAPGANCVVTKTYTVTQADVDAGSIVNVASTTGTPPGGGTPPTDTTTVTVPGTQCAAIEVVKTADVTEFDAVGDVITYTLTTTNTGNVTLTDVTTTDALLGIDAQPCAASLAPGATCTVTGSYTVTQADLDAGEVVNAASTTGTPPGGGTPPTGETEVTTPGTQSPALSIAKSADVTEFDAVGDVITYTLTTTNTGNVTLTNVTTTDALLGIDAQVCAASLAPGANCVITKAYTVTQADLDAGSIVNAASTTGTPPGGGTPPTDETEVTTPGTQTPALQIVKTADVTEFDAVGDVITYRVTTTNTGNVTLTNVTTTDALLGIDAQECAPSLAPGQNCVVTKTYTVTQADLDAGSIVNAASTTGTPPGGGTPPTDETEVTTPGTQTPALQIVKTADVTEFDAVGDVITYRVTTTNTGNVTLTNVTTTDALLGIDAQECAPSLAPGQNCVVTKTYTVTQADLDAGSIVNAASTTGTPPGGGTPPTDETEVTTPGTQTPALQIVKTADVTEFDAVGDVITYTLTTTNTGNVTLTNVTTTDALLGIDAQECAASLAPGQNCVVTGTYTITQADLDAGSVLNAASSTGTPPGGGTPPTTETEVTTPGTQSPAIQIVKTADVSTYTTVGQVITYTLTSTNTGNVTLTDVTTTDALLGIDAQECATSLAPGQNCVVTGTYTITQADLDAGSVLNAASTTGTPPGTDTPPPTSETEVTVPAGQTAAIQIVKTVDVKEYDAVGDVITYTLTTTNTGNVTLRNVTTSDALLKIDAQLCAESLAPGATCVITKAYTITQADLDAGKVVNVASSTGVPPNDDTPPPSDEDTVTVNGKGKDPKPHVSINSGEAFSPRPELLIGPGVLGLLVIAAGILVGRRQRSE